MAVNLVQEEEKLRVLIRKIDSEISRFEKLKNEIGSKRAKLENDVKKVGLQPVLIKILSSAKSDENIETEINKHILDLNKSKNFINTKLNVVIKEEELIEGLRKKYGKDIDVKTIAKGDFELILSDKGTALASKELAKSRKMLLTVNKSLQAIAEEEEKEQKA